MEPTAKTNIRIMEWASFLSAFRPYEGILPIYFAAITGSYALAMLLFSLMHISSAAFEIPTGIFSDKIGRKKTLVLHFLLGAIGTALYLFATTTWYLVIASILLGLSLALRSGTASAYVFENLEVLGAESEYKRIEGRRKALSRYGLVFAGLVGVVVLYYFNIQMAIAISLVSQCAVFLLSLYLRDVGKMQVGKANIFGHFTESFNQIKGDISLRNLSIGHMFARGAGNSEYRLRALFFGLIMPDWLVSLLALINNLITGLFMQTTHWIVTRFGYRKSLVHLGVFDRLVTIIFVFFNTITGGFIMIFVTSMTFAVREVALEDLFQRKFSKDRRATMGSVIGLGSSIIYSIFAIVFGICADMFGLSTAMIIAQPIIAASVYFYWRGLKNISY